MHRFITHDPVAAGWFNLGKSSATHALSQWDAELVNTEEVLHLLCDRLLADYESLSVKMRRAWTSKEVVSCRRLVSWFPKRSGIFATSLLCIQDLRKGFLRGSAGAVCKDRVWRDQESAACSEAEHR